MNQQNTAFTLERRALIAHLTMLGPSARTHARNRQVIISSCCHVPRGVMTSTVIACVGEGVNERQLADDLLCNLCQFCIL
jgi:hypothetical protein